MSTKKIADLLPKKESTRKIADIKDYLCKDPAHEPPLHQLFDPGIYEHECPTCGKKKTFTVPLVTMSTKEEQYDDENPDYIRNTEDGI